MTDLDRVIADCPFCGSKETHVCGVSNGAYVECRHCRSEGPFGDFTGDQAIDAWNKRPSLAALAVSNPAAEIDTSARYVDALAGAAPVAWADKAMIEIAAKAIFENWNFGAPVAWAPRGNSLKQNEARAYAREAIDAIKESAPHAPAKARGVAEADVERAAKAMAEHDGWHGWDTAIGCNDTLGGNTPDKEREHYRDIARVALATFAEGSE